jgi:hypothetical protein
VKELASFVSPSVAAPVDVTSATCVEQTSTSGQVPTPYSPSAPVVLLQGSGKSLNANGTAMVPMRPGVRQTSFQSCGLRGAPPFCLEK